MTNDDFASMKDDLKSRLLKMLETISAEQIKCGHSGGEIETMAIQTPKGKLVVTRQKLDVALHDPQKYMVDLILDGRHRITDISQDVWKSMVEKIRKHDEMRDFNAVVDAINSMDDNIGSKVSVPLRPVTAL